LRGDPGWSEAFTAYVEALDDFLVSIKWCVTDPLNRGGSFPGWPPMRHVGNPEFAYQESNVLAATNLLSAWDGLATAAAGDEPDGNDEFEASVARLLDSTNTITRGVLARSGFPENKRQPITIDPDELAILQKSRDALAAIRGLL
jgi:hypothetical protein